MSSSDMTNVVNRSVVISQANPTAQLRLFCFPYAGGGATIFKTWSSLLPSIVEICAIQLPGREERLSESPFICLSHLIESLATDLQRWLDKPFVFFGHSLGAIVAFELTRYLLPVSQPLGLLLSACPAPMSIRPSSLHPLPDHQFIAAIQQRYQQIPQALLQDAEAISLFLPTLRADFTLYETYTYSPSSPLTCPITVFGGLQDALVSRQQLTAWRTQTSAEFSQRWFPGGHFFLKSAQLPLLQAIAQILTDVTHVSVTEPVEVLSRSKY